MFASKVAVAPSVIESPITATTWALCFGFTSIAESNNLAVVVLASGGVFKFAVWLPVISQLVCLASQ
ncbi:hypothetical protein D3C76_1735590 [compost metagenome]